jgi:hypothetical protein
MANAVDDKNQIAFSKEMLVAVPILGSAIALVFDVGYFSGIDINLFTLFSLNEHLAFALEPFPYALVAAALVGVFSLTDIGAVAAARLESRPIAHWLIGMVVLIGLGFAIYFGFYLIIIAGMLAGYLLQAITRSRDTLKRGLLAILIVTTAAFSLGRETAHNYLRADAPLTTTIQMNSDTTIRARIIRSGDRGLLVYDPLEKRVTLIRWDEITKINVSL